MSNAGWSAEFEREVIAARPRLLSYAMSLCKNKDNAEDLVQGVMAIAFFKFDMYREDTNLIGWLMTVMRNFHLSNLRKRKYDAEDPDGIFASHLFVNEGQSFAYDLKIIKKRMRLLNSDMRQAIELVGIMQYKYEEAAEMLNTQVGTVKSRVHRARAFLETGELPVEEVIEVNEEFDPNAAEICKLFKQGKSVSEIASIIGDIKRSHVMRVISERNLTVSA